MALPKPNYSFTIPSVHDDTLLDCRLYHPKQQHESELATHRTKAAIVAHPYAPLGGSYDDPVVASIGKALLSAGYIVGTFNFRGGGGSPGRTSWSAKPELADYVSFYGFMLSYLSAIHHIGQGIPRPSEQHASSPVPVGPPDQENMSAEARQPVRLILAGYSYGSMIASHLPPIDAVLNTFRTPPSDSAAAEISLRASAMARLRNKDVESRRHRPKNEPQSRGRSSLRVADAPACPGGTSSSHAVSVGGFESEPTSRRISRESARRSLDVGGVRQSIDRVRERFASRQDGSSNSNNTNPNIDHDTSSAETETPAATSPSIQLQTPQIEVCYLLISPLLPPIASFTTMFSTLSYLTTPTTTTTELTLHPSLAVYGDKDTFTSRRGLRKWAEQLQQKAKSGGSRFEFCEVEGAGHFWHEGDAVERMTGAVRDWLGEA